jgi:CheY-like chemotaxis protein
MIVLNLAINARDAMPEGGSLSIATSIVQLDGDAELASGDYVQICVRDTGTGMDAATLERAMEPFFTTKPVGKGTGLGLAQIYGSARQSGGTVQISSSPGQGTSVRVLFPCTDQRPQRRGHDIGVSLVEPTDAANILLVDDDDDLRSVLASALEAQGYQVTEAEDGSAALSALERATMDIAILDFAMPGMNGAELSRRMRERWPGLPILFASGYADTEAIETAAGNNVAFLKKPFRIDELLHVVHAKLRQAEEAGARSTV